MRCSIRFKTALAGGTLGLLLTGAPLLAVQPNGLTIEPRVFNDFPLSTETTTINGGVPLVTSTPTPAGNVPVSGLPASVIINDTNMVNAAGGGYANRDDILISTNNGVTPYTGNINQGYTISADVTLTDGSNSPRKEVGIRVNSSAASGVGDALFLLNSDAGEIVAFGAGAPFYSFRPAIEAAYVPGQTIFMKEQYLPGSPTTTAATPGTMQYWAQLEPGGPLLTSGALAYSNSEGGPVDYNFGFYDQAPEGATTTGDFVNAQFNNIQASTVPEPGMLSVLALGGMTLLSRRRAARLA